MAIPTEAWELVNQAIAGYRQRKGVVDSYYRFSTTVPSMIITGDHDSRLATKASCLRIVSRPGLIRELAGALRAAGHLVRVSDTSRSLTFVPLPG